MKLNNNKKSLKNKKLMLSTWGCQDRDTPQCRDWIPLFQKMFGELIIFGSRNYYYAYGKESLNKEFLEILQREKPDFLLFGPSFYGQFSMETIAKIKEISPKTKTIIEFGDDDWRFEDWSRYYALFFDYIITAKKEISIYKKEKIKDVFFLHGISPHFFKKENIEKIYDVSFIGRPIADRYDFIKFLKNKEVNIKLFGIGWQNYSDLKDIYGGILHDEDYPKTINQSRINLNFSKTLYKKGEKGQLKGRILEVPACGAFLLTEYTPMGVEGINKKEEINFTTKEELLEKIKYYLKNESEREKIAKELHKYILTNYSWDILFKEFFEKIDKYPLKEFKLPKINKKTFKVSEEEINLSLSDLREKLKNFDYVYFTDKNSENLSYREYLQAYSLFISKKPISCCDYYLYSDRIGDYMLSLIKEAFYNLEKEKFLKILSINQLMVTKEFFLKNLEKFRKLFLGEQIEVIEEKNITFVSIPLVKIKKTIEMDYNSIKKSFHMLFIDELSHLFFQKKIFNSYIIKFLTESACGKGFMTKYLLEYLKDVKSNSNILKSLSKK